ncbi:hypothetical protein ACHAXT_006869 [Thalassiosira profunda]
MTASGYHLRPYDPSRESDVSSLEEICANVYGGGDYLPNMAASYAANPDCSFLALTKPAEEEYAGEGDAIVAVANYSRLPAQCSAWIEAVRTHPGHRNQGLASSLLRSIVDLSQREGEEEGAPINVLTCTIQSNRGMLRALEKEGFTQQNTIQIMSFAAMKKLPGWTPECDQDPQPLLDALDLHHLVSSDAKSVPASSWSTISTDRQLLDKLRQMKSEGGTCGYLPGLYEYIVPGPNRLDLKQSMEQGLVLALDIPTQKETSGCDTESDAGGNSALLVFTQDERISSLRSKWVCSIVAYSQFAFEAALWHAHSPEVAKRMQPMQSGSASPLPFCLVFDDAVPLTPGTLAHAFPRVIDQCVVLSYQQ